MSNFVFRTAAGIALLCATLPAFAADSVSADTSGNGILNGKYWVRQVIDSLHTDGTVDSVFGVTGAMTFDGKGHYTFVGQEQDTITKKLSPLTRTATYRIGANGVGSVDSILLPLNGISEAMYGGVGANGIFTGSAVEGDFNDMFVAIPAGAKVLTNAALSGSFFIGHVDFPSGDPINAHNSLFRVTADGKGAFGTVTVTGRETGSLARPGDLSQPVTAASYNFNSDGSATVTFPTPAGVSAPAALFTGAKTLYLSADGNYLLGGDPAGYDIFFGVRPLASTASSAVSAAYFGVYYYSSVDSDFSDPSNPYFASEYGSINAFQGLKTFWHQRTSTLTQFAYDFDFDSQHTVSADGSIETGYYRTVVSADGQTLLIVGEATEYTLLVANRAPAALTSPTGVTLNNQGVLNAASYSPITAPLAPGELITLFGSNLTGTPASAIASTLPFPPSLAGVQVMINDRPAPVYAVSPTQISAIVPYLTSGDYAKVQVINNGTASNVVTLFNRSCAPGIFAVPATGSGYGAILHANYQLVSPANPAKRGEVVQIYLTGLGAVKPSVNDGAPGPVSPFSTTINPIAVRFGSTEGTVQYNGLAPGSAGLYQVNVQVPSDSPTGDVSLDVYIPGCEASQVRIPVVAGP